MWPGTLVIVFFFGQIQSIWLKSNFDFLSFYEVYSYLNVAKFKKNWDKKAAWFVGDYFVSLFCFYFFLI